MWIKRRNDKNKRELGEEDAFRALEESREDVSSNRS